MNKIKKSDLNQINPRLSVFVSNAYDEDKIRTRKYILYFRPNDTSLLVIYSVTQNSYII